MDRKWIIYLLTCITIAGGVPVSSAQEVDVTTIVASVENTDDEAIRGATVMADWSDGSTSSVTASNGMALLDVPKDEQIELTMEHPEYTLNFPVAIEEPAGQQVTLSVAEKASLTVVTNGGDSRTITGATVELVQDDRTVVEAQTDQSGQIESGTIEAGRYIIDVRQPGFFDLRRIVNLEQNKRITLSLEPGGVTYEFKITDPHFDPVRPVEDAVISIPDVGDFRTLGDGRTVARVPVNTEVDISVTKQGYQEVKRAVNISEERGNITFEISRTPQFIIQSGNERVIAGEKVGVTVTNAYGEPAEDVVVRRNGQRIGRSDENGDMQVEIPEAGEFTLTAGTGSLSSEDLTVIGVNPSRTDTEAATPTPTSTGGSSGFVPGLGFSVGIISLLCFGVIARRYRSS